VLGERERERERKRVRKVESWRDGDIESSREIIRQTEREWGGNGGERKRGRAREGEGEGGRERVRDYV
jgi:hypothetical protein